jgi:hypothetical protein
MAQQTDPNDQAFATPPNFSSEFGLCPQEKGLSKREYFAAMAMQALVTRDVHSIREHAAHQSVLYADALIKELNKEK